MMNRKQRRSEKKAELKARKSAPSIEQNFATAVEHHRHGRLAEAETHYRKVLAASDDVPQALLNLGMIVLQTGRFDQALELMQRLIVLQPDHAGAHNNMGSALHHLGRLDEAAASLEKSISIDPEDAYPHNNLGNVLMDMGQLEKSIPHFQKAIQIEPEYAGAHYNLGIALKDLHRLEEAAKSFQSAIDLTPNFAEAHFNLGSACKGMGQTGEAIAHYIAAIRLRPDYNDAWNNLTSALKVAGYVGLKISAMGELKALLDDPDIRASRHFAIHEYSLKAFRPHEADENFGNVMAMMPSQTTPASESDGLPGNTIALLHFGRSGTGLMHSLIDSHPQISTLPSIYLGGYFNYGIWQELAPGPAHQLPERFAEKFAVLFDANSPNPVPGAMAEGLSMIGLSEGMTTVGDNRDEALFVDRDIFCAEAKRLMAGFNNIGPGLFLRIVHQAYEFALDNGAQKETIFYHIHNPGIFSTFNFLSDMPDARLMMMVRDPVKSLESWVREAARDNEYATLSLFIISMLFSIDRVAFRRQESIGVRLEDLKSRPKETMRALCKWIGIEETPSLYEMTAQGKKWWGDPTSPDYDQKKEMSPFDDACFKRPTGYVFSERDCFLLETLFHPFSVRFGYQEDDPDRFKGNLKEARTMLEDLFDFEQNIIENTNGKPDEFRQSGDHLLLRATLTDRLDVLEEFGTYPHMLKPLVLDESA